jgi:hypothetical protein
MKCVFSPWESGSGGSGHQEIQCSFQYFMPDSSVVRKSVILQALPIPFLLALFFLVLLDSGVILLVEPPAFYISMLSFLFLVINIASTARECLQRHQIISPGILPN